MTASPTELRELADALNLYPGVVAREWTPGENWTLLFTASAVEGRGYLLALAEVLNVLLAFSEVTAKPLAPRPTGEWQYRLSDGDHVTLAANLRATHKELWRKY